MCGNKDWKDRRLSARIIKRPKKCSLETNWPSLCGRRSFPSVVTLSVNNIRTSLGCCGFVIKPNQNRIPGVFKLGLPSTRSVHCQYYVAGKWGKEDDLIVADWTIFNEIESQHKWMLHFNGTFAGNLNMLQRVIAALIYFFRFVRVPRCQQRRHAPYTLSETAAISSCSFFSHQVSGERSKEIAEIYWDLVPTSLAQLIELVRGMRIFIWGTDVRIIR